MFFSGAHAHTTPLGRFKRSRVLQIGDPSKTRTSEGSRIQPRKQYILRTFGFSGGGFCGVLQQQTRRGRKTGLYQVPGVRSWFRLYFFDPAILKPCFRRKMPKYSSGPKKVRQIVIRLSLGRRLVNLSPVAQRTNAFHKWRRRQTMGRWSWVRISRPPWKRFLKKSVFPHGKNLMNHSPWVPRDYKRTSE